MYMTLEEATHLLPARWENTGLRERVRCYVGELPEHLGRRPRAVIARHLASPNLELMHFARRAAEAGLSPCCAEFTADRFHSGNPDKLLLAKMIFYHGRGRKGGSRLTTRLTIDITAEHRKPLARIRTLWGEPFVDFHHRLLSDELPGISTSDCSEWLRRMGGSPAMFWPRNLALFLCYGILFDNFHCRGHEADFTRDIIRPAFKTVERKFGLAPLVVALVPRERERERYWSWYPGHVEQLIDPHKGPADSRLGVRGA